MRFYFRRLFTFVYCLFSCTFMFGGKSLAEPGDYLIYYMGEDFKLDGSLRCCCCGWIFAGEYSVGVGKLFYEKFGPYCYVKYNRNEKIEDVFAKAKKFNNSEELKRLRAKFFNDAEKVESYEKADALVKTYLKDLNGLFCYNCMNFVLLTFDTEKYYEYRNVPSKVFFAREENGDNCGICSEKMVFPHDELMMCKKCRHCFHKKCIETWFNVKNKCPYCNCERPKLIGPVLVDEHTLFDDLFHSWLNTDQTSFCVSKNNIRCTGSRLLEIVENPSIDSLKRRYFNARTCWCEGGKVSWGKYMYTNSVGEYKIWYLKFFCPSCK